MDEVEWVPLPECDVDALDSDDPVAVIEAEADEVLTEETADVPPVCWGTGLNTA